LTKLELLGVLKGRGQESHGRMHKGYPNNSPCINQVIVS